MTDTNTTDNSLLNIMASLNVTLGNVAMQQQRMADELVKARTFEQPVWLDVAGQAIATTAGIAIIPLITNSPDQGHQWNVRRLWVGGVTPTTVAAGRVDVYRGNALNNSQFTSAASGAALLAQLGLVGWEDFSTALPQRAQYARGELVVAWPDDLFCVITGATSGQQYVAVARIQDTQQAAYRATTEM